MLVLMLPAGLWYMIDRASIEAVEIIANILLWKVEEQSVIEGCQCINSLMFYCIIECVWIMF